ncbi:ribosomal large subunit pseudouridine synthase D [Desulfonispora thiosulfatigenes DSM 11270]|uniref:Pseudouridine synthase n=1 Tax=Desulfonispora thiosulfatigenes DSM 11270 TaxID=656914 RepID=A0A1W1VJ77_DESTI|nr:RluA family pseudouridine synthase [Desulfonispora thiosulfatigenes]SMB93280.1 ribosomal large subunit pseudouridine synthase D [Desulfonispora thiosulfatigenes DSM 11270]
MQEIFLKGSEENEGQRLDAFLSENIEEISRSYIQKLIKDENIKVNNQPVKSNYKIKATDSIIAIIPEPETIDIKAEEIPLDIIYEDDDVLVINKAVGMVVHPAVGNYTQTLVNALLYHCKDLSGINGKLRPGIVHRIDKDTSGLLMVAKNDHAHQGLANQLKDHSVDRAYMALVHGVVTEPGGIIDAPIGRHPNDRQKMAVTLKNSKEAVTKYYVKERFTKYTLVECKLETGRTHQIRVHMSYINHPLVGDITYGWKKNNLGLNGQALHAYMLGFVHPRTGEKLNFTVPMPDYFQNTLSELRKEEE